MTNDLAAFRLASLTKSEVAVQYLPSLHNLEAQLLQLRQQAILNPHARFCRVQYEDLQAALAELQRDFELMLAMAQPDPPAAPPPAEMPANGRVAPSSAEVPTHAHG